MASSTSPSPFCHFSTIPSGRRGTISSSCRVIPIEEKPLRLRDSNERFSRLYEGPNSSKMMQRNGLTCCMIEFTSGTMRLASRYVLLPFVFLVVGIRPACALPASVVSDSHAEVKLKKDGDHECFEYCSIMLEEAVKLLASMEEVEKGNENMKNVELGLQILKRKEVSLRRKIIVEMDREDDLTKEKDSAKELADEIEIKGLKLMNEWDATEMNEKVGKLEQSLALLEQDYHNTYDKINVIDQKILRRKMALSIGIRHLSFIRTECEELVKKFRLKVGPRNASSSFSEPKLTRDDIERELDVAQRKFLEEVIIPDIIESNEHDTLSFATSLERSVQDPRNLHQIVERENRKKIKRADCEEKVHEPYHNYLESEMSKMPGDNEGDFIAKSRRQLYTSWKIFHGNEMPCLKKKLLEEEDFCEKNFDDSSRTLLYRDHERILLDRDRVMLNTWYNDNKKRWEIAPLAVPFAVSRKLVALVRIRHDWNAGYLKLKGGEKEYFLDIKEFNMLHEGFCGFSDLYMKMLIAGIPTSVELMPVNLYELDIWKKSMLMLKVANQCLNIAWNHNKLVWGNWVLEKLVVANDDILMIIVFPLLELIFLRVRMVIQLTWNKEVDLSVAPSWFLKWKYETEMRYASRQNDEMGLFLSYSWALWIIVRVFAYGYLCYLAYRILKKKLPRLLGFGPFLSDSRARNIERLKSYFQYKRQKIATNKKAGMDPIKRAFDDMKRVKNPPIQLKDFVGIDSIRDEINEVVSFLQNPKIYQEMGARPPKGVLIVGGVGTGKKSLGFAIAAEAKVPVVTIKPQQLEARKWIGQGASNVRELFQTARDLAPVIIFVEDFDIFAGKRGKYMHSKMQEHEAFINQLLVELDGFDKQEGVVLIATTTNIKHIDEALRRPGRMDRILYLCRPTETERLKILLASANQTMDESLVDFVDWKKVAEKTTLLRPVELKCIPVALEGSAFKTKFLDADELLGYCGLFATFGSIIPKWIRTTRIARRISRMLVEHLGLSITKEDLHNVVDLMEPYGLINNGMELQSPPLDWTRETKLPHAVWAAGRGLIAVLLPNFAVVDNLWLEPSSWQGIGCTKISKAKNGVANIGNTETRSYLEKKLVFCFGSYIASKLLLPTKEENLLSASELNQAQEIATRMVIQYGWGPTDSPAVYYASGAVRSLNLGNEQLLEIAGRVEEIYDMGFLKAKDMLLKNRGVLQKIVEELLDFEVLSGKDLDRIILENRGIRESEPFFLSQ